MTDRHPSYDHYIISSSKDVSPLIRLRDIALTTALWAVYVYFIRDIWPFAQQLALWAWRGFDDLAQYPDLKILATIQSYGQVAGIMTAIYLGWAIYNMLRFRGRQRRKARADVTPGDLAAMYGVSAETVENWQAANHLVMYHDAHGHLTDVKVGK